MGRAPDMMVYRWGPIESSKPSSIIGQRATYDCSEMTGTLLVSSSPLIAIASLEECSKTPLRRRTAPHRAS